MAELDITIKCEGCGAELADDVAVTQNKIEITVTPCPNCLKEEYDKGCADGSSD